MREWEGYLEHFSENKLFAPRENVGKGYYTCFPVLLKDMGCAVDYQGLPWCVTFVFAMFWLEFGEEKATRLLGRPTARCGKFYKRMKRRGQLRGREYRPKQYDIVFYDGEQDGKPSHIGIILSSNEQGYESIEGNATDESGLIPKDRGGAVAIRHIKYDYPLILGYAEIGGKNYGRFTEYTQRGFKSSVCTKRNDSN